MTDFISFCSFKDGIFLYCSTSSIMLCSNVINELVLKPIIVSYTCKQGKDDQKLRLQREKGS